MFLAPYTGDIVSWGSGVGSRPSVLRTASHRRASRHLCVPGFRLTPTATSARVGWAPTVRCRCPLAPRRADRGGPRAVCACETPTRPLSTKPKRAACASKHRWALYPLNSHGGAANVLCQGSHASLVCALAVAQPSFRGGAAGGGGNSRADCRAKRANGALLQRHHCTTLEPLLCLSPSKMCSTSATLTACLPSSATGAASADDPPPAALAAPARGRLRPVIPTALMAAILLSWCSSAEGRPLRLVVAAAAAAAVDEEQ